MKELDLARLRHPEGGSLNDSVVINQFVKRYRGPLARGGEKLRLEADWLRALPSDLAPYFSRPQAIEENWAEGYTALHLAYDERPALAKAILDDLITPARTAEALSAVFNLLTNRLYPLRTEAISGPALYERFHGARMRRAVELLAEVPEIRPLVTGRTILVNGVMGPSIGAAVAWMDEHAGGWFHDSRIVTAHGDTHLDNILVSTEGDLSFSLIDPRGEPLIPAHYDYAKALKAVRTGYDLIHYGGYEITAETSTDIPVVSLRVNNTHGDHYRAGTAVLLGALPAYAECEGVTEEVFRQAVLGAEVAHIISFASYHAHHPAGCDVDRVRAYLAIASLLAHDLMTGEADVSRTLPIWDEAA